MAAAEAIELFNCTPEQFFQIVSDYEKYPEFLDEVKAIKIVESQENKHLVEYEVSVIKSFKYRLWMNEKPNAEVSWTLDSGDLFKKSVGSWILKEKSGKVQATYKVDAAFKVFVPSPVAKALINVNLPNMMKAYHKRVKELYGK